MAKKIGGMILVVLGLFSAFLGIKVVSSAPVQKEIVENKKWEDALSKLEVVLEMIEQIPKTYSLKVENIL